MTTTDYSDKSVLIVDDQKPFLIMLKGIISSLGAKQIQSAGSAEAALSACRKEKFDFIIADLHLGANKKNGSQLLEEIRVSKKAKPDTVFIMVSGDSHRPIVLGSIERSPDDYIIKPFSQAQLSNRLSKAHKKKQILKPIYVEIFKEDYQEAINVCLDLITQGCKYRQTCAHLLTELYWKQEQFDAAKHMLAAILKNKPVAWAQVAMAKTEFFMGNYEESIELAKKVLAARLHLLEGHDILANCYLAQERIEDALREIRFSLDLSPFSMERQYMGATIGRVSRDFEFARQCCKELFEQSKRSVYKDLSHMCNFVRSILDAAQYAEDKGKRNKYQQEALLTLQRLRNDELVIRKSDEFDYSIYENIVSARVNMLDGKALDAKRLLAESQMEIEQKFPSFPMVYAPDSIKVMTDLGEFADAQKLASKMKESDYPVDDNIQFVLDNLDEVANNQLNEFTRYNEQGIQHFNEGKYQAAMDDFSNALKYSPVNADVAINLLQCLRRLMSQTQKPELVMMVECKKTFRLVEGIPLSEKQTAEFIEIKEDLSKYMDLK
ncbi:MAG: response regulator [Alteromonadaceae bacterium]|nr:response regulator [Alteromonadaceae bacterium]